MREGLCSPSFDFSPTQIASKIMVKRSAPVHLGQGASAARATKKVRGDKASPSNAVAVAGEGSLSASGGRGALRARFSSDSKGKGRQLPVQETRSAVAATASTTNGSSSVKASDRADEPTPAFEVIAGSYERLLYGLHCTLDVDGTSAGGDAGALQASMEPIFQFPAHLSSVKTAAASPNGRYLVTGAADDVIKLWDLRRRKEIGGLLAHESKVEVQMCLQSLSRLRWLTRCTRTHSRRRHHELDFPIGPVPGVLERRRNDRALPHERLVTLAQIQRSQGQQCLGMTCLPLAFTLSTTVKKLIVVASCLFIRKKNPPNFRARSTTSLFTPAAGLLSLLEKIDV